MDQVPTLSRVPYWLPSGVLVAVGLLFTGFLYFEQDRRLTAVEQSRFEQRATETSLAVKACLDRYTEVVFGLRGLFSSNPDLTRVQFERAAQELDATSRNPGLVNLAFTRRVSAKDLPTFEWRARSDAQLDARRLPSFSVHPRAQRDEYFVADFVWPLAGNEQILGFDIGSQPANMKAMEHARATGEVVVSKPFMLVQATQPQPGFVIRVPVYDVERVGGSVPSPEHFLGAVAATVDVLGLMRSAQLAASGAGLDVELADLGKLGAAPGSEPAGVFYQSTGAAPL
ncbi:MAG: CHASE domain-containing protein, partial [Giesbergeria sp.]